MGATLTARRNADSLESRIWDMAANKTIIKMPYDSPAKAHQVRL